MAEGDFAREWHARPISTITGVIALVVLVAGFGGSIQAIKSDDELADRRLTILESAMNARLARISEHDVAIEVLRAELRMMNSKLASIDGKVDQLVDDNHPPPRRD